MKKLAKVIPFFNHGRWLARCPKCKLPNKIKATTELFICGNCYPGKLKKRYSVVEGKIVGNYIKKAQENAKHLAYSEGAVYEIDWPKDAKDVEKELRKRKLIDQSFVPESELPHFPQLKKADTLASLRKETKKLGYSGKEIPKPKEREEKEQKKEGPKRILKEKDLRRIE